MSEALSPYHLYARISSPLMQSVSCFHEDLPQRYCCFQKVFLRASTCHLIGSHLDKNLQHFNVKLTSKLYRNPVVFFHAQ